MILSTKLESLPRWACQSMAWGAIITLGNAAAIWTIVMMRSPASAGAAHQPAAHVSESDPDEDHEAAPAHAEIKSSHAKGAPKSDAHATAKKPGAAAKASTGHGAPKKAAAKPSGGHGAPKKDAGHGPPKKPAKKPAAKKAPKKDAHGGGH
ncbi:MAG: hypothetical protein H7Y88_06720 [Phycisphaerales bacterium]|nr:hypothetical protein [Phycisphaerales bacterium]